MADPKWAVQAPDGKVIQFPDNFTDADVNREMGKLYGGGPQQAAAPQTGPSDFKKAAQAARIRGGSSGYVTYGGESVPSGELPKNYGFSPSNVAGAIGHGAADLAGTVKDVGADIASNPNWVSEQPAGQRPSTAQKFIYQPADEQVAKAKQALDNKQYLQAAGHGLAAAIPMVGPWAASLGEQAGTGDVGGAAGQGFGGSAGAVVKPSADLIKLGVEFNRRATSLNEVTQAASGIYQGKVQPLIQTLKGAIVNEGAKTIQQAIEADKQANMVKGQGTIATAPAVAEAAKAIEETGHTPTPQTRTLLNRLNNSTFLTLEDAKNLRSDIGGAASRAERTGQAKLGKVLWTAYDELGEGMKGRIQELSGSTKPFDHYNNEFRAYYELNKGIAGQMQESIADRHEAIKPLKDFASADLTELKDQAKAYGLDPAKWDEAQKNAKSVVGAHDALSGKYNKSVYRLAMAGGLTGGIALSVYAAAHGAGLYGLAPMLGASYIASKAKGLPDAMETGRLLQKLKLDPEKFQVRQTVEGPQTFDYPNQDDVYSSKGPTPPKPLPPVSGGSTPDIDANTQRLIEQIRQAQNNPPPSRPGMGGQAIDAWQESIFGKKPAPDIGSQVRAKNPEPTRAEVKAAAVKRVRGRH